jgi:hypothetical protein
MCALAPACSLAMKKLNGNVLGASPYRQRIVHGVPGERKIKRHVPIIPSIIKIKCCN